MLFNKEKSGILNLHFFYSFYLTFAKAWHQANLKKLFVSYHPIAKKKSPRWPVKFFFYHIQTTFHFKCYLHHNCSIIVNWNNTLFYSSAKPLCNVSSYVFWFVNFFSFHFCVDQTFRNGRKTDSVMYTSE